MGIDYSQWVGKSESAEDILEPGRSQALSIATGGETVVGDGAPLPALHHWLYFWDVRPPAQLGEDGHPLRGGFLPPVELPRRMWAGGRVEFNHPLCAGEAVARHSTILGIEEKAGRSGALVFVTVEHRYENQHGVAIKEEQDLVFREATSPGAIPPPALAAEAPDAPWHETIDPDPVLLFRYSALTLNGHRIHYDRPYAREEEHYPELVVHGPLQATLLAGLASRHLAAPMTKFDYRGQSPAFYGATLHVCGKASAHGGSVWTEQGGRRNMVAEVTCEAI